MRYSRGDSEGIHEKEQTQAGLLSAGTITAFRWCQKRPFASMEIAALEEGKVGFAWARIVRLLREEFRFGQMP
jgi:hypothetical protein